MKISNENYIGLSTFDNERRGSERMYSSIMLNINTIFEQRKFLKIKQNSCTKQAINKFSRVKVQQTA